MKKLFYCILSFTTFCSLSAQDFHILFKPQVSSIQIDSVLVTNLKTNQKVKLFGGDSLLLTTSSTSIPSLGINFKTGYLFPNPCYNDATLIFTTSNSDKVILNVHSTSGQLLYQTNQNLSPGLHRFLVQFPVAGIYFLAVMKSEGSISYKAVCNGIKIQRTRIAYEGGEKLKFHEHSLGLKSGTAEKKMTYLQGDILFCSAFSGAKNTVMTDSPKARKIYDVEFYECRDYDKRNYSIVKIGSQWWTVENLQSVTYNEGSAISHITDNPSWGALTAGAYCWYANNEVSYKNIYGALYNWYAVNTGKLCPLGWHVPTDVEWTNLENYLIAGGYNFDGTTTGNKIALSLTSAANWTQSSFNGTAGYSGYSAYRNKTGFSGLPGGHRSDDSHFHQLGETGGWWSNTALSQTEAWFRYLGYGLWDLNRSFIHRRYGIYVRCVLDTVTPPHVTTIPVNIISQSAASCGGNVTSDGGAPVIARGVCWNTIGAPTISDNKTTNGTGMGTFTSNLTGLTANILYYVRAYATNSKGTSYGTQIIFKTNSEGGSVTLTDVEGNVYRTVTIGTQVWMAENLKTTKYWDGTSIPVVIDYSAWQILTTGACCWYNNDVGNKSTYGALYNYFATVDSRKLCPAGWHVPTDAEWTTLENYLIANGYNYDGTSTGNKIGKSLAETTNWYTSSVAGSVGNTDYPAYRNKTGFSALPGGYRSANDYATSGFSGSWWSSSERYSLGNAWFRNISWDHVNFIRFDNLKICGMSVRCLRD